MKYLMVSILMLFGFCILTSIGYADLNDGLIAYYPFNGNANDESGNGHNGTVHSATLTTDRFGNPDSAYYFDGLDDYIRTVEKTWGFDNTATVCAWIMTNYEPNSGIVSLSHGYVQDEMLLQIRNNKGCIVNHKRYSDFNIRYSDTLVNDGVWHFLCGQLDGSGKCANLNIFFDGVEETGTCGGSYADIVDTFPRILRIGARTDDGWKAFKGIIDDIRIYNRVLSANEILALYNEESGQEGDNKPYFDGASLPSSITIPDWIYFSGYAIDDKGLSQISMKVSGPSGTHTIPLESINGTSHSLGSYYFNSGHIDYANKVGSYSITLTIEDTAGQTTSKSFSVSVSTQDESWQKIASGVHYLHRHIFLVDEGETEPKPRDIHVLKVDLSNPNISLRPIMANDPKNELNPDYPDDPDLWGPYTLQRVIYMAENAGALAAINADYSQLKPPIGPPQGTTIIEGDVYHIEKWPRSTIIFSKENKRVEIGRWECDYGCMCDGNVILPSWAHNAISGGPRILRDGEIVWEWNCENALPTAKHLRQPRTGVAISKDQKTLLIAVVDGRQDGFSAGMTPKQFAELLKGLGGWDGMDFDGGGSTTMVIKDGNQYTIVNKPSVGDAGRRVANALGIFLRDIKPMTWLPLLLDE